MLCSIFKTLIFYLIKNRCKTILYFSFTDEFVLKIDSNDKRCLLQLYQSNINLANFFPKVIIMQFEPKRLINIKTARIH